MQPENLIPADVFCAHHHIEVSFIQSLQEYGLLEITTVEGKRFISEEQLNEAEKLKRLHYDMHINMEGLDAIRNLLHQMQHLQQEMMNLKNHLRLYNTRE